MKLSEKIQLLRKENGYSQEELAALCHVSRQAISKWEADIALPETEKLILLSNLFHVTIDVLLKDELSVQGAKESHTCGINMIRKRESIVYEGILIKESIADETALDFLDVNKIELWKTQGKPKYWTVLYFSSSRIDFPQIISKCIAAGNPDNGCWFADFKAGNVKFIVFHDKILKYRIGCLPEKLLVCDECRKMGIPDEQMRWPE